MLRGVAGIVALCALGLSVSGCGQVNHSVSHLMADAVPQWAGGLPDGLPPRPGEPGYDEFNRAQMERSLTATAQAWPQGIGGSTTAIAAAPNAAPSQSATPSAARSPVPGRTTASAAPAKGAARHTVTRPRGVQSASAEAIY
jgi:hypothetical protein